MSKKIKNITSGIHELRATECRMFAGQTLFAFAFKRPHTPLVMFFF